MTLKLLEEDGGDVSYDVESLSTNILVKKVIGHIIDQMKAKI